MSDKLAFRADTQLTITLASLATSSTLLVGRESTSYDNSSNGDFDLLLSGKITTGTSPTADKRIEVWVVAPMNDTPTWPDAMDGSDGAHTFTNAAIKRSAARLAIKIDTDSTSDRTYGFTQISVASLFGGTCPAKILVFVTHDTAVNLNSTGSNHEISIQPVYLTAA